MKLKDLEFKDEISKLRTKIKDKDSTIIKIKQQLKKLQTCKTCHYCDDDYDGFNYYCSKEKLLTFETDCKKNDYKDWEMEF